MSKIYKLVSDTKAPTTLQAYVKIEYIVDAANLAEMLWSMRDEEQAHFFNALGSISKGRLSMQLQRVSDCGFLEDDGRKAMSLIGYYAVKED
jgi:hypothetical protein